MSALTAIVEVIRQRARLHATWLQEQWRHLPETAHPLAVSNEEVEAILGAAPGEHGAKLDFLRDCEETTLIVAALVTAETALASDRNWRRLVETFAVTGADEHLLITAIAVGVEPQLARVYAYLHDQPEWTQATPWLAAALFDDAHAMPPTVDSPLRRWQLLVPTTSGAAAEVMAGWAADAGTIAFLRDGPGTAPTEADAGPPTQLDYELVEQLVEFANLAGVHGARLGIELVGVPGAGRKTLARQAMAQLGMPLVEFDLRAAADTDPELRARLLAGVRRAALEHAALLWEESERPGPASRSLLDAAPGLVIAVRDQAAPADAASNRLWRSFAIKGLTRAGRERLWAELSNLPCPRQVRDWMLTPGEIARLVDVAPAGEEAIRQACRRPVESIGLLAAVPQPFTRTDLIVPETIGDQLDSIETQVRFRWDVYEDWGFERLAPNGRGIIALFAGPSGTGKTMAAQVLARSLGLELFRLDPSQVVNKFIGETEKRLKTVFDECDRAHFMMLVDECEGLFGQRFNSKDAHDRYANLEIDYLLQRLERFQGVAILSTNRKSDIDPAFLRRIRFVVDFMPPGPRERLALWKSAIPEFSPNREPLRGVIDWDALADKATLTGAEIKLAALNAAFIARARNERIGMPQILTAVRRELAKKGQTLRGLE